MANNHSCTNPITRKCWDCAFCGDKEGCSEPVNGYGEPINEKPSINLCEKHFQSSNWDDKDVTITGKQSCSICQEK